MSDNVKPSSAENRAESAPSRRVIGRPFKAGQPSANPGGRPKDLHAIRELARSYAPKAIETLVTIMLSGGKDSVRAAEALLDRGFGKATQVIAGEEGSPAVTVEIRDLRRG